MSTALQRQGDDGIDDYSLYDTSGSGGWSDWLAHAADTSLDILKAGAVGYINRELNPNAQYGKGPYGVYPNGVEAGGNGIVVGGGISTTTLILLGVGALAVVLLLRD